MDGNGKVFIYSRKNPPASWGTTTSWPATLADTQATYVITADAASSGKFFGVPLAPVGNFDGSGVGSMAISAQTYGGVGRVVIVKGSSTFGSITLPDATHTVVIDGTAAAGAFGFSAPRRRADLQHEFDAHYVGLRGERRVRVCGGGGTGSLLASASSDSLVYSPATGGYGYSLGFLGALGGSSFGIAVTANVDQIVDIHLGTAATGPFMGPVGGAPAPSLRIKGPGGNSWGAVNIGGGVPASTRSVSFIGNDNVPDLVLAGQAEPNGPNVFVVDGKTLSSATGTLNISNAASPPPGVVVVPGLPADWNGHGLKSTVVPDVNGDGFGDFAVGEAVASSSSRTRGRLLLAGSRGTPCRLRQKSDAVVKSLRFSPLESESQDQPGDHR